VILEIATGVCLGIVAAYVLIRHARRVLAWAVFLVFWGAVVAVLLWLYTRHWPAVVHVFQFLIRALAVGAALVAFMWVLLGLYAVWSRLARRYPALKPLEAIARGEPPWDRATRAPVRLIVLLLVFAVVLFLVFCAAALLDWGYRTYEGP
jgi:hypothetical protein